MSSKARLLLKKLRAKIHDEDGEQQKERAKSEEKRTLNLGAIKDEKSGKVTYHIIYK